MSRAIELIESLEEQQLELSEGQQFRTTAKVQRGARHVRHLTENARRRCMEMMNPDHPSPNPADEHSYQKLNESAFLLSEAIHKLRQVKESQKPYRR